MPALNAMNATPMLFVMIRLEASGFIATIECVHISRRLMVSTICGPRTRLVKSGSREVSTAPGDAAERGTARATPGTCDAARGTWRERCARKRLSQARGRRAVRRIDGMVSPREQLIERRGEARRPGVLAHGREVGRDLPVQHAEFLQFLTRERANAALRGGIHEGLESPPVRRALIQPAGGDHEWTSPSI